MNDSVIYTRENQVGVLTLNRPEHMNAMSREMTSKLEELTSEIKKDPYIRIVVLRAAGEVFMAGSDLYEVNKEIDSSSSETMYLTRQFNSVAFALREMDKIVLASVHGLVAGQGMSLMMAADLVIASDTTRFSMGYCNIATSPAGGITNRLPRLVGHNKAMELLLMSEMFDVQTAVEFGMVNWVVSQDEQADYVHKIVDRIIHGPTLAYTQTKQLLNSTWQNKLSAQLELESESFVKTVGSRDFKAAVRAFINKRQPEFEGR